VTQEETTKVASEETPVDSAIPDGQSAGSEGTESGPLAEALAAAKKEAQDYKEGWLRERADFNNYKKRTDTQMKDLRESATVEALLSMLPIIDDFERATSTMPEDLKTNPWINGMSGIHRKFQKMLEDKGVTVLDPVGEVFDPAHHEAVMMEASDTVESGHVIMTLQKGYLRGDKVLRPALVKVAT
jgi:molecular chaperone GrpE